MGSGGDRGEAGGALRADEHVRRLDQREPVLAEEAAPGLFARVACLALGA